MAREKKWGNFPVTESVESAFEAGKSDIEGLAEEMSSWRDNMSGTSLENTEKYQTVEEAANTLENAQNSLDQIEIPEKMLEEKVTFNEVRKKGYPRWVRLSNATAALQAVADLLHEKGEADNASEEEQAMTDAADKIQAAIDEVEGVDFPGMF